MQFLPPPTTTTHWAYDDPSGLPDPPAAAASRPATVVRLPRPKPATPKAA